MADTAKGAGAEPVLDESLVHIVTLSDGHVQAILDTLPAWKAPAYMVRLALALERAGWGPYPSMFCGVHLYFADGLTTIWVERPMPDGRRQLL